MDCNSCSYLFCRYWPAFCATFDKEIVMAKDMGVPVGEVVVTINEKDGAVLRNALKMYIASKVRAANANSDDGDLNNMYNAQARYASDLARKFGG